MKWWPLDGSTCDIISLTRAFNCRHQFWPTRCYALNVLTELPFYWQDLTFILTTNVPSIILKKISYIDLRSASCRSSLDGGAPDPWSSKPQCQRETRASDNSSRSHQSHAELCWGGSNTLSGFTSLPRCFGHFLLCGWRGLGDVEPRLVRYNNFDKNFIPPY